MTNLNHYFKIAEELGVQLKQVDSTVALLDEGATVPFISRYRKEVTGSLDEVQVAAIRDRVQQLRDLDKRKDAVLKSIKEQGKLSPELEKKIEGAETMATLEDIYLPYKPKRRTKGTVAKEKGLEPLASQVFEQPKGVDPASLALEFVNEEKEVLTAEDALQGARDIIAEWVNEDASIRKSLRELFIDEGVFSSRVIPGKEEEAQKFKDYFEWSEPIKTAPSHRVLAMRRGEKELFLMLDACPEELDALSLIEKRILIGDHETSQQVKLAIRDSYKRLLKPSMETEVRLYSKKKADEEAIRVFAENLRQLLLSAPLGERAVIAIDPGFRTGCKMVALGKQGQFLEYATIFPNEPQRKTAESGAIIKHWVEKHHITAIGIGNGTASRETESFVRGLKLEGVIVVMVNESGASIYSASEAAREEFPDQDLTVRGAISIGRRLMDPLAELVKIDPKSIGVGQYQHDVDQSALKNSLDDTVMSCVNGVGVEVNTASKQLLTYVSGLGPSLAQNIVNYRDQHGPFRSREEIRKVPRLGDKAFEQAAGFLRIRNGENPLDSSAVHPERYDLVKRMAKDIGYELNQLLKEKGVTEKIALEKYVSDEVGLPTLRDIMEELAKPGRDPRESFEVFEFQEGVNTMKDLKVGMKLPGIVSNITKFGAFVDIGVHQDGLVHLSHLADKYVKDPTEIVMVNQKVEVTVVEVDIARKRIALSMKSDPFGEKPKVKAKKEGRKEEIGDGDLATKLAMLKGKFNKK